MFTFSRFVNVNTSLRAIHNMSSVMRPLAVMGSSMLMNTSVMEALGVPSVCTRSFATWSKKYEKAVFRFFIYFMYSQLHCLSLILLNKRK